MDALVSLSGELHCPHFHRRQDAKVSLYALVVVVIDVSFDRLHKGFSGSESPAVIAFPFQNAPEALHPAEIKKTASPDKSIIRAFSALKSTERPVGAGAVICMSDTVLPLDGNNFVIPSGII